MRRTFALLLFVAACGDFVSPDAEVQQYSLLVNFPERGVSASGIVRLTESRGQIFNSLTGEALGLGVQWPASLPFPQPPLFDVGSAAINGFRNFADVRLAIEMLEPEHNLLLVGRFSSKEISGISTMNVDGEQWRGTFRLRR